VTRAQVGVGVVALTLLAGGCGRASQEGTAGPTPSVVGSASTSPVTSAAPSASVAAASGPPQAWHGKYTTTAGSLVVPKDWAKTHWSSSDTTAGVGDGSMQLTVDPGSHRVSGTLDGAIGAAVVEGVVGSDGLTASVRRKEPTDKGLAGTLVATVSADKVTGTLTLTTGDGAMLRTGTFTLTPGGP
jgi:hypothetical protein